MTSWKSVLICVFTGLGCISASTARYIVTVNHTYCVENDFDLHLTTARDFFPLCDIVDSFDSFKRYGYFMYALTDTASSRCTISTYPHYVHIEEIKAYSDRSIVSPFDHDRKDSALSENSIFSAYPSCYLEETHHTSNSTSTIDIYVLGSNDSSYFVASFVRGASDDVADAIMRFPVVDSHGSGDTYTYLTAIHTALKKVLDEDENKIILGYLSIRGEFSLAIAVALNALSIEMLLIAPAGDESHLACMSIPAYSTRVLTVAAASPTHMMPLANSNYGGCINMYTSGQVLCSEEACVSSSVAASLRVLQEAQRLSSEVTDELRSNITYSNVNRTMLVNHMHDAMLASDHATQWADGMHKVHEMPFRTCNVGVYNYSVATEKIMKSLVESIVVVESDITRVQTQH